jgi:hypothetical protein
MVSMADDESTQIRKDEVAHEHAKMAPNSYDIVDLGVSVAGHLVVAISKALHEDLTSGPPIHLSSMIEDIARMAEPIEPSMSGLPRYDATVIPMFINRGIVRFEALTSDAFWMTYPED